MNSAPVSDDPYIMQYKSASINSAKAKNKNKNKLKFDLLPITKRQSFAIWIRQVNCLLKNKNTLQKKLTKSNMYSS